MTQGIKRRPTHPGAILREEFVAPLKLSKTKVADALGVSRRTVLDLMSEHRAVTTEMAVRLGAVFNTSEEFWLNLQRKYDLWHAKQHVDAVQLKRLIT